MRITLIRHGKSVDSEDWHGEDAARPLTREGAQQVRRCLKALRPVIDGDEIWTSPWLRARQTAEQAAELWERPLAERPWLAGDAAEPQEWLAELRGAGDVVLVGHEPDLGKFIGFLVGGRPMPLKKGGVAVLEGLPRAGGMDLRLFLSPKLLLELIEKK
jgi:phosphohistidine phosphatase